MKSIILMLFLFLLTTVSAHAEQNKQNSSTKNGVTQQIQPSTNAPTGNRVQNQTHNNGEDQQLQIQEQSRINNDQNTGKESENKEQNSSKNINETAKQIQKLLLIETGGSLGEQVKHLAKEQNIAQTQIHEQLNKLESRNMFLRFMLGTDYQAIKNLKEQLVQNQLRIEQLTQLQNKLSNQNDLNLIQETIQTLEQENTSIQERITTEEQTKSMFGWLFRFFQR